MNLELNACVINKGHHSFLLSMLFTTIYIMKACPKLPSSFEEQEMPQINHIEQKIEMTAKLRLAYHSNISYPYFYTYLEIRMYIILIGK